LIQTTARSTSLSIRIPSENLLDDATLIKFLFGWPSDGQCYFLLRSPHILFFGVSFCVKAILFQPFLQWNAFDWSPGLQQTVEMERRYETYCEKINRCYSETRLRSLYNESNSTTFNFCDGNTN
jgi:hypothetical protein